MPTLVNRFHLLLLGVSLATAGVALLHVPEGYAFPAHWRGGSADWLWPRDIALAVAPAVQVVIIIAFAVLGRTLTKNHLDKTRHILDPSLTLLLTVPAACQLGLLLLGIGSDFDFFRIAAVLLAATMLVLSVVLFEAERHSYGGLRLPWTIRSDTAWTWIHRATGMSVGLAAVTLAWLAWSDAGPGILTLAMAASLLGLPLLAGVFTLAFRRF